MNNKTNMNAQSMLSVKCNSVIKFVVFWLMSLHEMANMDAFVDMFKAKARRMEL